MKPKPIKIRDCFFFYHGFEVEYNFVAVFVHHFRWCSKSGAHVALEFEMNILYALALVYVDFVGPAAPLWCPKNTLGSALRMLAQNLSDTSPA